MSTVLQSPGAYGAQMARYFCLGGAQNLVIASPSKPPMAITRLFSESGLPERTGSIPSEKAFVVSLHLTPASPGGCDIWVDDKQLRIMSWPAGGVGIYDLESNPRKRNPSPVDWVHYYVPRSTLDAFADDAGTGKIEDLRCSYGTVDAVLHRMTQLVLPALANPLAFCELFLDYFRLLFCTHVCKTYGPSFEETGKFRGGLAPWQKKRVTELVLHHLDGTLPLSTLASECGLSVSHFARSFRRTFSTSAHKYLILQRIKKAQELLTTSELSLAEVGLESGFADQAAFSRTFKALVGASPLKWQREVTHRPA